MKSKAQFSPEAIKRIDTDRILGIRAGTNSEHRVIGIWAVVIDGRVFARSYTLKTGGWWRTLLGDPYGQIYVYKRKRGIKVRAVQVKSEKLKERISAAYREKYNTPGSVGYVVEMSRPPSRDATVEFLPL